MQMANQKARAAARRRYGARRRARWGHLVNKPPLETDPFTKRATRSLLVWFILLCPSLHLCGFWPWLRASPVPTYKWKSLAMGVWSFTLALLCTIFTQTESGTVTPHASTCCYPDFIQSGTMGSCSNPSSPINRSDYDLKTCARYNIPAIVFGLLFAASYVAHMIYVRSDIGSAYLIQTDPWKLMMVPEMWLLQPFTAAQSMFEWGFVLILNALGTLILALAMTALWLNASRYFCNSNADIIEDSFQFDCSHSNDINLYFIFSWPLIWSGIAFFLFFITYVIGLKKLKNEIASS